MKRNGLNTTESQIIQQIQDGNERVFEALFRSHYVALHRFASRFIDDSDEAEEMVQDVFFKIWEKRSDLKINTSLKAYLYSSVRNACLNYIKHQQVKATHEDHVRHTENEAGEDVEDQLQAIELEEKIRVLIHELPEKCREVFRMSRFEEMKYQDIAEQLNISVKTVENQMGKALKHLRNGLRDYGEFVLALMMWWVWM